MFANSLKPRPHQQQRRSKVRLCRSNIRHCRKNRLTVAFDNVASTLLLVWTGLNIGVQRTALRRRHSFCGGAHFFQFPTDQHTARKYCAAIGCFIFSTGSSYTSAVQLISRPTHKPCYTHLRDRKIPFINMVGVTFYWVSAVTVSVSVSVTVRVSLV